MPGALTPGPRHLRRAGAPGVVVLPVVLALLTGCSSDTPTTETRMDAHDRLDSYGQRLHTQMDALMASVPVTDSGVTLDEDDACGAFGHDEWPRQYNYAVRSLVGDGPSTPHGEAIIDILRGQDWSVRDLGANQGEVNYQAAKDGFIVQVSAASTDGFLNIVTASPCVAKDGTVDSRNPS